MVENTYDRIKQFCLQHGLLQPGEGVVIGLSGGADSVFLLYTLVYLRQELGLKLCAVHIDHGIRGQEAREDAEICRRLAAHLSVEFRLFAEDIPRLAAAQKISTEEAGRNFRYQCFEQVRSEMHYEKIAVGHHRDDQAETMLWQMLRGSGVRGLGGIRPKQGRVIRPLLFIGRDEIERELLEKGISWREDYTNQEEKYTRNTLRNRVLPYLEKEIQPSAGKHLANLSEDLQMMWDFLERQTGDCYERLVEKKVTKDSVLREISIQELNREEPILRRQLILYIMEELSGSWKDVGRVHMEAILSLTGGESGKRVDLPYGMRAGRDFDCLWISRQRDVAEKENTNMRKRGTATEWEVPVTFQDSSEQLFETSVEFKNSIEEYCVVSMKKTVIVDLPSEMPKNLCTKWFDYDKINADMLGGFKGNPKRKEENSGDNYLRWRFPMEGDYLYLRESGGRKKLSRIFIDEKIPSGRRDCMPILAMGSHVIWIPELGRTSAAYYVTDNTKNVLVAHLVHKFPTKEKGGAS